MAIFVHLANGKGKALCGCGATVGVVDSIERSDCTECLWRLATMGLMQLTAVMSQLRKVQHPIVVKDKVD